MYEAWLCYDDGRRVVIEVPNLAVCGEDFCETCGDCLACYGDGPCTGSGWHFWAVEEERLAEFLEIHDGARIRV